MPSRIEIGNFKNPENKPLGELRYQVVGEDKLPKSVNALDKRWAPRSIFTNYISLVASGAQIKAGAALDEWKYEAECFRDDMLFLLNRRHHEFWSYMVYQKSALAAVVSFLQRATPFYIDVTAQVDDVEILHLYEEILCLVIRLICRLITNKESAESWLTKEHMRELIYTNYLISVPMLFDLLVAVGDADGSNSGVLRKIFDTLLAIEPNYKNDLLAGLVFFRAAFRSIQTQAENEGFEGAGGGIMDESLETPYDDVALYTLDCAYTLSVLLEVCPTMRTVCCTIKMGQSIAHFYDNSIPFLYKNIYLVNESAASLAWLNQARVQFLKAFRSIAYHYVDAVLSNPSDSIEPSENFVALLTECLSEQTFVIDYERSYPVHLDVDILKQACKDLDDFKASFVANGYQKEAMSESLGSIAAKAYATEAHSVDNINNNMETATQTDMQKKNSNKVEQFNGHIQKENTANVAARDIDLDVTAVLDVLPHLGTGFVRRLLARYDTSEEAIAAILEENLPPDLINADQNEPYIPPDPADKLFEETGLRHFNVHDGDAYDVMTQDQPACIIKQGKGFPNAPQNAAELLDDKRDIQAMKERYQQYSLVTEGGDSDLDEYNDEYDDSYEALLESETRVLKSKDLKARLADVDDVSDDESDDQSVDSDKGDKTAATPDGRHQGRSMDFCENPEVVRARYEARRQAKWQNRGGGGGSGGGGGNVGVGSGSSGGGGKQYNVVGAPKGQGQDKETLRNRNKKEVNKSTRANHNRKAGAAFKRSKGMLS